MVLRSAHMTEIAVSAFTLNYEASSGDKSYLIEHSVHSLTSV